MVWARTQVGGKRGVGARWEQEGGWCSSGVTLALAVGTLVMWVVTAVMGWHVAGLALAQRASINWPVVGGQIVESRVAMRGQGNSVRYRAVVRYRAEGPPGGVVTDTVRLLNFGPHTEWSERQVVSRYPVGARVPVYRDPNDPNRMVLEPWLVHEDVWLATAALTAVLVCALLGAMLRNRLSNARSTRVGGLVITRSSVLVLRTSTLWPVVKALIGAGAVAFMGTLATREFMSPLFFAMLTGVLAIGALVSGYWYWRRRAARSQDDLVIDPARRVISPPCRGGERKGWTFEQIARVGAVRQILRAKNTTTYEYQVWLEPVEGAGVRAEVVACGRQSDAEAVRGWILDHLGREEGTWDEVVVDEKS